MWSWHQKWVRYMVISDQSEWRLDRGLLSIKSGRGQWVAAQFGGTHAEQLSHLLDATENSDKEDPTPFSHYTDLFIHIFRKFS